MCCAPCAIYPVGRLRAEGNDVTGYFYNPNIHPYLEYRKRMDTAMTFAAVSDLALIVRDEYDLEHYLTKVLAKGTGRCEQCYRIRLDAAAAEARAKGFTAFSTSLLYSKYQKHDVIRGVAEEMAREHGVLFHYEDFRAGWSAGIRESRRLKLYRQQYCGCIFSEEERYRKV
jgi:predicted adenine nucleotide alpha hydrolase (AANH) superfamily ATPase